MWPRQASVKLGRHRGCAPPSARLWNRPRKPLTSTLYFRGWLAVLVLPVALLGQGLAEIVSGTLFGAVWLAAAGLLLVVYVIHLRRPVKRDPNR